MEISESPQLIGRGSHCQLVLDDPTVSTTHAEFVRRANSIFVKDLNSTNGTFVNGTRLVGECRLNTGDTVQIGDTFFGIESNVLRVLPPQIPQTQIASRQTNLDATRPIAQTYSIPNPPVVQPKEPTYIGTTLSGWIVGLLWGGIGVASALFLSVVFMFISSEQTFSFIFGDSINSSAAQRWDTSESLYDIFYFFWILTSIAILTLLVIWSYKTYLAAENLRPGNRSWARGWSIGAWFIPLANYVLLTMIVGETHKIVHAPRSRDGVDPSWRRSKLPPQILFWFVFYGAGSFLHAVGQIVYNSGTTLTYYDEFIDTGAIRAGLVLMLFGLGSIGAGTIFGIRCVKEISDRLRPPQVAEFS